MMETLIEIAYRAWSSGAELRARRERYKNYTYGDQWCDLVQDRSGRRMREDEFLRNTGAKPLTNNLIRQLVKTIIGRYRTQVANSAIYRGKTVADFARANSLCELDSRLLEEFLISGCAIQRISSEKRQGGKQVWVENVDPRKFFVNKFHDPRGWDIDLIGMLHDLSFAELVNRFGATGEDVEKLRQIYEPDVSGACAPVQLGQSGDADDFFNSSRQGYCRVVEMWTFDSKAPSEAGKPYEFGWHCRWLAPDGTVLADYMSPYRHGSHPFVVKFYPLTDGEVHSFVEDIIDNQRYINRLIVTIDKIMGTAAKGVLLFPVKQMTDNITWDHVTKVWAQSDGVIPISGVGEHLPQQVITNTADSGAYQLLQMELKLLEDISGVSDALLGNSRGTARGADMLNSQIQNATIALADLFETFSDFTAQRNAKALSN